MSNFSATPLFLIRDLAYHATLCEFLSTFPAASAVEFSQASPGRAALYQPNSNADFIFFFSARTYAFGTR